MENDKKNQIDYELLEILVNESASAIYIADYETDELLFLNETGASMLGVDAKAITGKKCFEFLMHLGIPCPFCHKTTLSSESFTDRTITLPMNQHQYRIRSKLLQWNGRKVHVHYISDETMLFEEQKTIRNLTDQIAAGIGIYYVYSDGRVEPFYLNDGYYAMIGSTREKRNNYYGFTVMNAILEEDAKSLQKEIDIAIRDKRQINHEVRVKKDDGTYIWLGIRADIVDKKDDHYILYCVYSDIDQLKKTQEELQQRYEDQVHYSRVLSSSSLASSMVNLTKNCISLQETEDNDIMTVITRQTPQEGFESMYPHIPDEGIRKEYASIFNTNTIIDDFAKGITHKSIRHPYERMDYWMEASYDAVKNPRTGDLEVYCFAKDVTNEVIQQDVVESLMNHEYEEVLLINPVTGEPTILIHNGKSLVFDEQNKAKDFQIGLENYFLKYSADDDANKIAKEANLPAVKKALEQQKTYTISYSVYDINRKIIRKRATYTYLNKYKAFILCTIQDITLDFENEVTQRETLQNALSEAHRAIKAKTDFLSNMSHDMRTPMNAILGLSNLAMDLTSIDEMRDYMGKINSSGKQLLCLINDTLDVSRIENGKLTMNREYVMSKHLLMEGIASAKVVAEQKGVCFEVLEEGVQDNLLYVDAVKITKIFTNLLSNAIKFTPTGGTVSFIVKRLKQEEQDVDYLLVVKDTGIGMSQDFLKHIFEPFAQERTDYSTNATGTGLGMTIVKEMVDFLQGKIEIRSELNKGTEVSVWIPFQLAGEHPKLQEEIELKPVNGSHKVLVAEDHPLNAIIIKKMLEKFGYQVEESSDGKECVSIFNRSKNNEYAMILMDIRMPVMDGLEATKTIRVLEREDAKKIPIIAMTANAFEQDIKECLNAGMNAHLSKPIEPAKLYETLMQFTQTAIK